MQPWKQIGRYGTVGLELVLSMAICYWLGRWADGKFGTKFLALTGLLLGVGVGFRNLMKAANVMQKEAEIEEREEAERAAGGHRPNPPPVEEEKINARGGGGKPS